MAKVTHTVKYIYGAYSGTATVFCDELDDLETIEAKVTRQESLTYLPMCSVKVTITGTKRCTEEDY